MTTAGDVLDLIVPGLFERPAAWGEVPPLPAVSFLLGRAERALGEADYRIAVLELCGIRTDGNPPIAPLSLLGDGGEPSDGEWWRIDPVHLTADQLTVYLSGWGDELAITAEEAALLSASLQELWSDDGWRLVPATPSRWYLQTPEPLALDTAPPHAALGSSLLSFRVGGRDARYWRSAHAEVEMLFHTHPVNLQRRERRLPTIDGLWIWGGGRSPKPGSDRRPIVGGGELGRGIAMLNRVEWQQAPSTVNPSVAIYQECERALLAGDPEAWNRAAVRFDEEWLAPAVDSLRRREIAEVRLHGAARCLRLDRRGLRRWWRRPRPLTSELT